MHVCANLIMYFMTVLLNINIKHLLLIFSSIQTHQENLKKLLYSPQMS